MNGLGDGKKKTFNFFLPVFRVIITNTFMDIWICLVIYLFNQFNYLLTFDYVIL